MNDSFRSKSGAPESLRSLPTFTQSKFSQKYAAACARLGIGSEFHRIKGGVRGMLPVLVYKSIYRAVRELRIEGHILEIGAASGGATISIALAIQRSGGGRSLVSVEKFEGGSRDRFGTFEENFATFKSSLEKFGVTDCVRIFPGRVSEETAGDIVALFGEPTIAAMVIDADGRLYRDFSIFGPYLAPNALIVIDDYVDKAHCKCQITVALVHKLVEWGLLQPDKVVEGTLFGRYPAEADLSRLDVEECKAITNRIRSEFDMPV